MNISQLKRGLQFVKIVKLSALNSIFLAPLFFLSVFISYWKDSGFAFLFVCFMWVSLM